MKNILLTTIATLFIAIGMNANTTNRYNNEQPFVFVESGIEFAVFKDGQFDFNVLKPNHRGVNVRLNTGIIDFSFNTGHNYDTYVQYDDYGAVVQIENTPIFYDYYGRVNRVGNIHMDYNHNNLISRIGNMRLTYNRSGEYTYANGIINNYNTNYRYTNRHNIYRRPLANRVIVHHTPYRRTFTPVRCDYVTYRNNYNNNYRRNITRTYRRPGNIVKRNTVTYRNNNTRVNNNRNYNTKKQVVRTTTRNNNARINNNRNYNIKKQVVRTTTRNNNSRINNSRNYNTRKQVVKAPIRTSKSYSNTKRVATKTNNNSRINKKYAVKNYKNSKRTVASNDTRTVRR